MPIKIAQAEWMGDFMTGEGTITGPGLSAEYRRESISGDGSGTSPIAVLGASIAGCFTGALSLYLTKAGYAPEHIRTGAKVHVLPPDQGYTISRIELRVEAEVPGIEPDAFAALAERAKVSCPVAQALASVEIALDAVLI